MNPSLEQLFKNLKRLTLTVEEKQTMRQAIRRRLGFTQSPRLTASPHVSIWQIWWQHSQKMAMVGVLVVGIIFGGGLSLAAEGSLPGTLLYPLKTKINEPIVAWLAPTPISKIWWQTEVINRRLVESQQLLTQTKTKPATVQTLTQELADRIDDLEQNLAELTTEDAVLVVKSVRDKVEQELLSHKQSLAETVVSNKSIVPQVEQLDRVVRKRVENLGRFKQAVSAATTTPESKTPTITVPTDSIPNQTPGPSNPKPKPAVLP